MKSKSVQKNLKYVYRQCINTLKRSYDVHFSLELGGSHSQVNFEKLYGKFSDQFKNPNRRAIDVIKNKIAALG